MSEVPFRPTIPQLAIDHAREAANYANSAHREMLSLHEELGNAALQDHNYLQAEADYEVWTDVAAQVFNRRLPGVFDRQVTEAADEPFPFRLAPGCKVAEEPVTFLQTPERAQEIAESLKAGHPIGHGDFEALAKIYGLSGPARRRLAASSMRLLQGVFNVETPKIVSAKDYKPYTSMDVRNKQPLIGVRLGSLEVFGFDQQSFREQILLWATEWPGTLGLGMETMRFLVNVANGIPADDQPPIRLTYEYSPPVLPPGSEQDPGKILLDDVVVDGENMQVVSNRTLARFTAATGSQTRHVPLATFFKEMARWTGAETKHLTRRGPERIHADAVHLGKYPTPYDSIEMWGLKPERFLAIMDEIEQFPELRERYKYPNFGVRHDDIGRAYADALRKYLAWRSHSA